MGFLFTLSSVADYRITGDEQAKQDGIEAAEWLLKRYQPKGKFIQAWGAMDAVSYTHLLVMTTNFIVKKISPENALF